MWLDYDTEQIDILKEKIQGVDAQYFLHREQNRRNSYNLYSYGQY